MRIREVVQLCLCELLRNELLCSKHTLHIADTFLSVKLTSHQIRLCKLLHDELHSTGVQCLWLSLCDVVHCCQLQSAHHCDFFVLLRSACAIFIAACSFFLICCFLARFLRIASLLVCTHTNSHVRACSSPWSHTTLSKTMCMRHTHTHTVPHTRTYLTHIHL